MSKVILVSVEKKDVAENTSGGASSSMSSGGAIGGGAEGIIRMAVVSDGELIDYAVSDPGAISSIGNIYKGFVTNVFPGTQSCFVNI